MKQNFLSFLRPITSLTLLLGLVIGSALHAQERSKSLDFDDSLVEGLNKQPLDSYSQIADGNRKRKRPHLYQKRAHFDHEMNEKISALGLEQ